MNWLFWLGLAVAVSVVFALTALRPRGARQVGNTRLLAVGRAILLVVVAILFYFCLTSRAGH
jgi:hypothetical protein